MDPALRQAKRFEELLEGGTAPGPYHYAAIFDASSWRARSRSRRKFKLLKRLDGLLGAVLQPGETVHFLTSGTSVSFFESYFGGLVMYYLNRRAIVVTDRRLILLQIDSRFRPRELAAQLRYTALRALQRTGLANTRMVLGNGKKVLFSYVPASDRKALQALLADAHAGMERLGMAPEAVGFEDLCPHCFAVVAGRPEQCPRCGGGYKSRVRAALLSLAFPGLGDFYLGHRSFAVLEMFAAAMFWLSLLGAAASSGATPAALAGPAGTFFVLAHGLDALMTRHIADKGLYPAGGRRGRPQAEALAEPGLTAVRS